MNDEEISSTDRVPCRECGQEILRGARVCGYCESYQARWRNELRYYANITGVFTFIGTALFFSITLAPTFRRAVFWEDQLAVLRVEGEQFTLANSGDGDVFIYELELDWPSGVLTRAINDTLGTGTVLQLEGRGYHLDSDDELEYYDTNHLRVLSASDTLWSRALSEAAWDVNQTRPDGTMDILCFQVIPVSRGGNYWSRLARYLGREPSSVPLEGRVRAFSLDRGRIFESEFRAEGILFHVIELTEEGSHMDTGEPVPAGLPVCEVY